MKLASLERGTFKYSVEDYFQRPTQRTFRLSPNGQYLSYRQRDEKKKNHVYIKNTKTAAVTRVITEGENLIATYHWASNHRLVYTQDKGGDEQYHLFSVGIGGEDPLDLTPYDSVRVSISNDLVGHKDHMIIEMNKDHPEVFEPYKINIENGALEKLFENKDLNSPIVGYFFDKDGNLKAYTQQVNGVEYELYYRAGNEQEFQKVLKTTWQDEFSILGFDDTSENPHDAFVLSNLEHNTAEIILYDLKQKKTLRKVYAHDTFDMAGISRSRKRGYEVDYYHYEGEKGVVIPVSTTYKKWHQSFVDAFGGNNFKIVSATDEEDKALVYVESDRLYGVYYLYDATKDSFKELFNMKPSLKPEDMAEMKPIQFKSRDGFTIYGYLTIPRQSNGKAPLIVNPHGGPYGVRSSWEFDPEVQLFASRGYATLQVNYRGSGGYGKAFFMAGNKQIGRKMLEDLEDGVAYVKTLDLIDEGKIAIYGGSYGGLATLGSLVKTPDLYVCGVDYVGVSNLFTFFKSFPAYWKPYLGQIYAQWYDENSPEDQVIMKQVSPALHVDQITKPVFVIQGANDPRVNIDESDQIVENLRNRGFDVPYMVKYNEGHGFGYEENRIELYQAMMGFFYKNLK